MHARTPIRPSLSRLVLPALLVLLPAIVSAQQDKAAERTARRLQLQIQNLQQQMQDAQTAKSRSDAEKAAIEKQLHDQAQEIPRAHGALRKASENLKQAEATRDALAGEMTALKKQLDEQKRAADQYLAAKDGELAQSTKVRDAQLVQLRARNDEQVKLVLQCTDKNQRLVKLSAELLDRYRNKGVADALKAREPLLGLYDVEMFNIVQEYRDKAEAERFVMPANRSEAR
jgi:chromosome segregation ATPase